MTLHEVGELHHEEREVVAPLLPPVLYHERHEVAVLPRTVGVVLSLIPYGTLDGISHERIYHRVVEHACVLRVAHGVARLGGERAQRSRHPCLPCSVETYRCAVISREPAFTVVVTRYASQSAGVDAPHRYHRLAGFHRSCRYGVLPRLARTGGAAYHNVVEERHVVVVHLAQTEGEPLSGDVPGNVYHPAVDYHSVERPILAVGYISRHRSVVPSRVVVGCGEISEPSVLELRVVAVKLVEPSGKLILVYCRALLLVVRHGAYALHLSAELGHLSERLAAGPCLGGSASPARLYQSHRHVAVFLYVPAEEIGYGRERSYYLRRAHLPSAVH